MKIKKPLNMKVRPKDEPARNVVRGIANGKMPGNVDWVPVGAKSRESRESHETQGNHYYQGRSQAGRNDPFLPSEVRPNDLGEVVDQSGKKAPYGKKGMGWANKSGKLGDLDPQEKDQPSWVGTWPLLNTGTFGAGVTIDENYGVQRPRTQSRQEERFRECNPEFQDVADDGDWTSSKWTPNV